jgi:C1A family cysteine protease
MPIPKPDKEKLLGGHAVLAVGYSNKRSCFLIRNSWGDGYGMNGYFLMPYDFITSDLCGDFWVLETVSDDEKWVDDKGLYDNVSKKKRKKKKRKSHESDESSLNVDMSDDDVCKNIKVEVPDGDIPSGKCLIRG